MLGQVALQVGVETPLVRELDRMVAAFPLREVALDDLQQRPGRQPEAGADQAFLRPVALPGKTRLHLDRRLPGEQRHPVMGLLPVKGNTVS